MFGTLFIALGRSWRFATSDLLGVRCLICQQIVRSYEKSPLGALTPEANSHCSTHSRDRLCLFIQDVISGLPKAANRSAFCHNIVACLPSMPSNLTGVHCRPCLMLAAHLLMHAPAERRTALDYYCAGADMMALAFCRKLLDEGADESIDTLSKMNSSVGFCQASYFCPDRAEAQARKKKKAHKASRSQEL
jgi:hypothetical protein